MMYYYKTKDGRGWLILDHPTDNSQVIISSREEYEAYLEIIKKKETK